MKFIEIENNLVNLDNVTSISKSREELIRIYFNGVDFIDIEKESEKEVNDLWERLKSLCMKAGEQE